MRIRITAIALALCVGFPALAAVCTWTGPLEDANNAIYYKAACATGSDTAPTTTDTDIGIPLRDANGKALTKVTVHAEAATAMTAASFDCYVWVGIANSASGQWHRTPSCDITTTAVTDESYATFEVANAWKGSKVAWNANGIGLAVSIFVYVSTAK